MAKLSGSSDDDQAAISGENTVTAKRLDELILAKAFAEGKTIGEAAAEMGSAAGVKGKGAVGVEAVGSGTGVVAVGGRFGFNGTGQTGISVTGTEIGVIAVGPKTAVNAVSTGGIAIDALGGVLAARF